MDTLYELQNDIEVAIGNLLEMPADLDFIRSIVLVCAFLIVVCTLIIIVRQKVILGQLNTLSEKIDLIIDNQEIVNDNMVDLLKGEFEGEQHTEQCRRGV